MYNFVKIQLNHHTAMMKCYFTSSFICVFMIQFEQFFLSDCHYYCLFVMNKFVGETNIFKTILLNYLRRKNWNERSTYDAQKTLI